MSCNKQSGAYTVYKHVAPSGKVYVGITSLPVTKRWQEGRGYRDCTLFRRAIQKYGWANIVHEIVAQDLTKAQACSLEQELIKQYKEENRSYNCSTGGELTALGCNRSTDFKDRLSKANKGKTMSVESRLKMSVAHKGKTPTVTKAVLDGRKKVAEKLRGRAFTPEHRAKLSQAKKGRHSGGDSPYSMRVLCLTNGTLYLGISEAARLLSLDASSICKVCKGKLKHYKGYVFRYAGDSL